jgi:hypothetical protein
MLAETSRARRGERDIESGAEGTGTAVCSKNVGGSKAKWSHDEISILHYIGAMKLKSKHVKTLNYN